MQVVWGNPKHRNNRIGDGMEKQDLIEYFDKALFVPELQANVKGDIFREFADLFVASNFVRNKALIVEMLTKRETLGSTGIGRGVAVPHGRTTAVLDVIIAFGKSEKGVGFNAIDKKPVHMIFVVLAPPNEENNKYLPVLGKLVETLSDKKNREKLMAVETYEDFIDVFTGE